MCVYRSVVKGPATFISLLSFERSIVNVETTEGTAEGSKAGVQLGSTAEGIARGITGMAVSAAFVIRVGMFALSQFILRPN